jgi:hypothetical protein
MEIVTRRVADDLDNTQDATETIPFSFDGMDLEIDLSEGNALRFRLLMAEFVNAARPRKPKAQSAPKKKPNPETVAARVWWRQEGGRNNVAEFVAKGRIPATVMERFRAARETGPLELVA